MAACTLLLFVFVRYSCFLHVAECGLVLVGFFSRVFLVKSGLFCRPRVLCSSTLSFSRSLFLCAYVLTFYLSAALMCAAVPGVLSARCGGSLGCWTSTASRSLTPTAWSSCSSTTLTSTSNATLISESARGLCTTMPRLCRLAAQS